MEFQKNKIIIILFVIILFLITIVTLIKALTNNKSTLNIYSNVPDINLKINNKPYIYKNTNEILEIKVKPGNVKIEATKDTYLTYEKQTKTSPKKTYNIEIVLETSPEIKEAIQKTITQFSKENLLSGTIYSIKLGEVKNNYAEAKISPINFLHEPAGVILKKDGDQWVVDKYGTEFFVDAKEETSKEVYSKIPLSEYLPYFSKNFNISSFADEKNELTYKITLFSCEENLHQKYFQHKIEALEWILSRRVDYKNLRIEWETEILGQ